MEDTLPNRIKYWLTDAKHDCFFVVGPEGGPTERIGAIKPLLMGDSEPFRAMLQDSELAEKGDIRVTDVEPDTFRNFLKCVYGASNLLIPKFTFEECAKLLYVVEKYLVTDLKKELSKHMTTILSAENIFVALSYPHCYQDTSLNKTILEILKFDLKTIATSENFLDLSNTSIAWILQQNCFTVKEIEIWRSVLRWAKNKTDSQDGRILRTIMLEFLQFFRFLTMEFNEFWEEVVSSEVLLEEEVNVICRSFVSGKPCSIQTLCNFRHNRYDVRVKNENVISSFMENPQYALIRCSVSSVGNLSLNFTYFSKSYPWREYFWHVRVKREEEGGNESLAVYLGCDGQSSNWSCSADCKISLIDQIGKANAIKKFSKTFSPSSLNWGFLSFCDWHTLHDATKGFVKDNSIILMVKIQLM